MKLYRLKLCIFDFKITTYIKHVMTIQYEKVVQIITTQKI